MLIVYDEQQQKYFGYFAAMAKIEGCGELHKTDECIEVTGYQNSLQAFKANMDSVKSLEAELTISGDFEEAGLVLCASDNTIDDIYRSNDIHNQAWSDYVWSANYISFYTGQNSHESDCDGGTA